MQCSQEKSDAWKKGAARSMRTCKFVLSTVCVSLNECPEFFEHRKEISEREDGETGEEWARDLGTCFASCWF